MSCACGWEFIAEASHINAQKALCGLPSDLQEQIALLNTWFLHDPEAYTVQEGAPVSDVLRGMLGQRALS